MCVYSMIADHYIRKWEPFPWPDPPPFTPQPTVTPTPIIIEHPSPFTPSEVQDLKDLLERAKEYDRQTGQPDCENEEKKAKLREIAGRFGVELPFL